MVVGAVHAFRDTPPAGGRDLAKWFATMEVEKLSPAVQLVIAERMFIHYERQHAEFVPGRAAVVRQEGHRGD